MVAVTENVLAHACILLVDSAGMQTEGGKTKGRLIGSKTEQLKNRQEEDTDRRGLDGCAIVGRSRGI